MSASTADALAVVTDYLVTQRPDLVTPAARLVDVPTGAEMVGPDAIGAWFYELTNVAIPGGHIADQRLHDTDHAVVVELTITDRSPLHQRSESHDPVSIRLCLVCDIGSRRIAEIRAYYDTAVLRGDRPGRSRDARRTNTEFD